MLLVDRELSALVAWAIISARFRIFFFFSFAGRLSAGKRIKIAAKFFFPCYALRPANQNFPRAS